jgi:folate-binding protein YgfZ
MNSQWQSFIDAQKVSACAPDLRSGQNRLCPLVHFGVLQVSGQDAATLLQGQLTCNVNDVNSQKSSFTAMCNPKGRVIATILLIRQDDFFLIVLPLDLIEIISKKLLMYKLRSVVNINDVTAEYCMVGVSKTKSSNGAFTTTNNGEVISIAMPSQQSRHLVLSKFFKLKNYCENLIASADFAWEHNEDWRLQDLQSGLAWLTTASSEQFIPQMLNLDQLGGVSFNKGCYTGQEIVARTHYLGKTKRTLFLAESSGTELPEPCITIIDVNRPDTDSVGQVVAALPYQQGVLMQIVLLSDVSASTTLQLRDKLQRYLQILPFSA